MTPNPYLSKSSLAAALEISESTVDEMVRRGTLPKPVRLSGGCLRWRWESVDMALAAKIETREPASGPPTDEGVQRAIKAAKEGRRGRAA
jgi:predicted DNA-binding transcriptional regulator AlpA